MTQLQIRVAEADRVMLLDTECKSEVVIFFTGRPIVRWLVAREDIVVVVLEGPPYAITRENDGDMWIRGERIARQAVDAVVLWRREDCDWVTEDSQDEDLGP